VERGAIFFASERLRAAILKVRPVDMIFVKENIVQLPLIDHFSTSAAFVEMPFPRFAQTRQSQRFSQPDGTSLVFASQGCCAQKALNGLQIRRYKGRRANVSDWLPLNA